MNSTNPAQQILNLIEDHTLFEKTITLQRNEFLKVKGNVDTNLYYIESGSLRIFVLDDFEEQIIRLAYKDNLFVVLDSFLTGKPSDFYIQTIKKTTLRVVSKSKLMEVIDHNPEYLRLWNQILELLILQQIEREKDILTSSPKDRYHRVLRRSPHLFQEVPEKHIANYLRMTPETLSRLKSLDLNQDQKRKNS